MAAGCKELEMSNRPTSNIVSAWLTIYEPWLCSFTILPPVTSQEFQSRNILWSRYPFGLLPTYTCRSMVDKSQSREFETCQKLTKIPKRLGSCYQHGPHTVCKILSWPPLCTGAWGWAGFSRVRSNHPKNLTPRSIAVETTHFVTPHCRCVLKHSILVSG